MRLRFIDESSCGASICTAWKARAVQCSKELSASAAHPRGTHASSPCSFTVDPINWLAESVLWTVKARPIFFHTRTAEPHSKNRSKQEATLVFQWFSNWMLEKRHKNVTQTFSGLNLNTCTINASASGLWQIKTAHKNLGCASVFMTVFICHKPSAFAFIVYVIVIVSHSSLPGPQYTCATGQCCGSVIPSLFFFSPFLSL